MEEDIKILENIITEYSTQVEDYKYYSVPVRLDERDIEALENILKENEELKEYKERTLEIDSKEAVDALHMLLHCSLKDTEYETQKEQFDIVISYISKLEEDNNNLKAASLKNDDYYKEVCNKNKELEEENENLVSNALYDKKCIKAFYVKFQNKRNEIFGCTYVDSKQWEPFDKALNIINDLEKEILGEE